MFEAYSECRTAEDRRQGFLAEAAGWRRVQHVSKSLPPARTSRSSFAVSIRSVHALLVTLAGVTFRLSTRERQRIDPDPSLS